MKCRTTSFGISPYLLQSFGDWGTAKVGYSFDVSRSASLSGFASPPIPTGGVNGQTLISNEEYAHFVTGDIMQFLQNSVDLDVWNQTTTTDANGAIIPGTTFLTPNGSIQSLSEPPGHSTSSRVIVTDTISYAVSRSLVVFASGGHEDIVYSNQVLSGINPSLSPNGVLLPNFAFTNVPGQSVHDLTWSFGATWTPNADSSLTLSYGHQNGFNSFSANGYYQATARTALNVSYGSTLGTQLEFLQNQLNLAASNGSGTLVNGLTGGGLFGANNALALQDGVFRTDTLTMGSTTTPGPRHHYAEPAGDQADPRPAPPRRARGRARAAPASWLHQMRPDMTISAAFAYSQQSQAAFGGLNANNSSSLVASLAWQYQISDTVSANVRYSYLERSSATTVLDFTQNMLIVGISKTF